MSCEVCGLNFWNCDCKTRDMQMKSDLDEYKDEVEKWFLELGERVAAVERNHNDLCRKLMNTVPPHIHPLSMPFNQTDLSKTNAEQAGPDAGKLILELRTALAKESAAVNKQNQCLNERDQVIQRLHERNASLMLHWDAYRKLEEERDAARDELAGADKARQDAEEERDELIQAKNELRERLELQRKSRGWLTFEQRSCLRELSWIRQAGHSRAADAILSILERDSPPDVQLPAPYTALVGGLLPDPRAMGWNDALAEVRTSLETAGIKSIT